MQNQFAQDRLLSPESVEELNKIAKKSCNQLVKSTQRKSQSLEWIPYSSEQHVQYYRGDKRGLISMCGRTQIRATIDDVASVLDWSNGHTDKTFLSKVWPHCINFQVLLEVKKRRSRNLRRATNINWVALQCSSALSRNRDFVYLEVGDLDIRFESWRLHSLFL